MRPELLLDKVGGKVPLTMMIGGGDACRGAALEVEIQRNRTSSPNFQEG